MFWPGYFPATKLVLLLFGFTAAQFDRSYHLNSNNFADQLTRNYQNPIGRQGQLTEEERNRLNALAGIKRIDDGVPHADVGLNNPNAYVITSPNADNSGDFSGIKTASSLAKSTTSLGQDLSGLPSTRQNPFAERNRLFHQQQNEQQQKFPANIHYERPADDISDFSYLYRSSSPPASQFQKQLQSLSYEEQLKAISDLVNRGAQAAGNFGQNVIESTKNVVETHRPAIENAVGVVKDRVQQAGSYIQETYHPAVQNVVNAATEKIQEFGSNIEQTGQPIVDNAVATIRDRLQETGSQFQQAGAYSQQALQSLQENYESAKSTLSNFIGRGIDRFDTAVPRYASQPPDLAAANRNRIVLDPLSPLLSKSVSIDSYLNSGTGSASIAIGPSQPETYEPRREIVKTFSPAQVVGGNSQSARTRILTKGSPTPVEMLSSTARSVSNVDTVTSSTKNFTTYPNFKADLFPELANQAKEDPRPATGRRLGPQGRFGGGTNEYREDLGKTWEINDRRPPWMEYPGMGGKPESTEPSMPLNRYSDRVAIENYPPSNFNPPPNEVPQSRQIGDDLSRTDAMGHNQFGPIYLEYTTPTPRLGQSTTIIAVPLNYGTEHDRLSNGPASRYIGSGLNPSSQRIILAPTVGTAGGSGPGTGQIQQYYGPEEITGSRYRNVDEYFHGMNGGDLGRGPNRYVKIDLLNE